MTTRRLSELVAIAVAEAASPPIDWRPVPLVFEIAGDSRYHFWPTTKVGPRMKGHDLPASALERYLSEHEVVRLPEHFTLADDQVVVCDAQGTFSVRSRADVESARRSFWMASLAKALEAAANREFETAEECLERARLAEGPVPIAAVLRRGMAEELAPEAPWREQTIDEFDRDAAFLELDLVRQSFDWSALPQPELRERWWQRAVLAAETSRTPPALDELLPVSGVEREQAVKLQLALRTSELRRRVRLPSMLLGGVVSGDPVAIAEVVQRLSHELDAGSPAELFAKLDAWVAEGGDDPKLLEELRALFTSRAFVTDYYRHARLLSRIEATLGNGQRTEVWKRAAALLNKVTLEAGLIPWQRGEEAAKLVREFFSLGQEPILRLRELLEHQFGLRAFATSLPSEHFDACHVADRLVPPASYVDERLVSKGRRVRFSLAEALGIQTLFPRFRGARLSPKPAFGPERDNSDEEQAFHAFAVYFIAPRALVKQRNAGLSLESLSDYRTAVEHTMALGLSARASFPHVANCLGEKIPWHWAEQICNQLEGQDDEVWAAERIDKPEVPEGLPVRLERADGFASVVARASRLNALPPGLDPTALLGDSSEATRAWFQQKVEEQRTALALA